MSNENNTLPDNDLGAMDSVVRLLGNAERGELYLSDVKTKAASALAAFGRRMAELLQEAHIPVPPAINLQTGESGEIAVTGNHPAAAQVLALLHSHREMLGGFKEVEVLHELVRTQEEAVQLRLEQRNSTKRIEGLTGVPAPVFNLGITSSGPVVYFSACAVN